MAHHSIRYFGSCATIGCRSKEGVVEYDARGIPLGRVCDTHRDQFLSRYRSDVLTDPNYWHDEPIEEEGY